MQPERADYETKPWRRVARNELVEELNRLRVDPDRLQEFSWRLDFDSETERVLIKVRYPTEVPPQHPDYQKVEERLVPLRQGLALLMGPNSPELEIARRVSPPKKVNLDDLRRQQMLDSQIQWRQLSHATRAVYRHAMESCSGELREQFLDLARTMRRTNAQEVALPTWALELPEFQN